MPLAVVDLPVLTINSGTSTSNAVGLLDDSWGLTLYSPSLLTGTITLQVEPTSTGTSFVNLQSGGIDVTIAASKAIVINPIPFRQLRLLSGALEGAARTFSLTKAILV